MFSYARTRAGLGSLLTIALAAGTAALTAPAARAIEAAEPSLTALSVVGSREVTPGAELKVSYSATDDGTTLTAVHLEYLDASSRRSHWRLGTTGLPLAGETLVAVPDGLPNEALRLASVSVRDEQGNLVKYRRDGSVCRVSGCVAAAHALDLSALDLVMSGSTPDNAVPEIRHLYRQTATMRPGSVVQFDLTVDDDHPLTSLPTAPVGALLRDAFGNQLHLFGTVGGYGRLSAVVPATLPDGQYTLAWVEMVDAVGNRSRYTDTGSVLRIPNTADGPTSHTLDFRQIPVTMQDSEADSTPPSLTGISYPRTYLPRGATGTVTVAASDESGISRIEVQYTPTHVSQLPSGGWTFDASVAADGTAQALVPPFVDLGEWWASSVKVYDKAGNWSRYYNSGTARECNRTCPVEKVDLPAWTGTVAAPPMAPGYVNAVAGKASARIVWDAPDTDNSAPVTGYTVTVSPGGKVVTASGSARALTVTGLSDNVKYTFAVRARNAVGTSAARSSTATPRTYSRFIGTRWGNGDPRPDVVGVTSGHNAYLYRGTGTGSVLSGVKVASGLGSVRTVLPGLWTPGDNVWGTFLGVGYDGYLHGYSVGSNGTWSLRYRGLDRGYAQYRIVVSPGDLTGDGLADLLGVTDAGDLHIRAQRGSSGAPFYGPRRIGGGWSAFTTVTGVGDLDGDRRNDLVARKKDGTLWLYAGTGKGGFYGRQIGTSTSWKSFAHLAGVGDFTGDKRNDLLALAPNGYLYVYKGNGKGGFSGKALVSKGFASFV